LRLRGGATTQGRALDLLGALAEHQVVLGGEVRIGIDARKEIAVAAEQARGEHAHAQILL